MRNAGIISRNPTNAWPGVALGLLVTLAMPVRPDAETVREMESSRGTVRITIVPMDAPAAAEAADSLTEASSRRDPEAGADSVHPVEAITDFTSLEEMAREAEAMLQVSYFDKASREELKFPLRYSELRRYLRSHPLEFQAGSLAERNVALMGDLARALRIKMTPADGMGKKP